MMGGSNLILYTFITPLESVPRKYDAIYISEADYNRKGLHL